MLQNDAANLVPNLTAWANVWLRSLLTKFTVRFILAHRVHLLVYGRNYRYGSIWKALRHGIIWLGLVPVLNTRSLHHTTELLWTWPSRSERRSTTRNYQSTTPTPFSATTSVSMASGLIGPWKRVPKSHSSCSSFCCYQFSKTPKAFLIHSGAQRNFAYTFMLTFSTDLPSQIFSWRNAIISVIKVHFMLSI